MKANDYAIIEKLNFLAVMTSFGEFFFEWKGQFIFRR